VNSLNVSQNAFLQTVALRLSRVSGVVAVVLGGSHARGTARQDSDLDIGLYYHESFEPEIGAIRSVAKGLSIPHRFPTVTECYEWEPWVNGGSWIHASIGKVDILYRLRRWLNSKYNPLVSPCA
jgi:predicted nucleotidyltransferase